MPWPLDSFSGLYLGSFTRDQIRGNSDYSDVVVSHAVDIDNILTRRTMEIIETLAYRLIDALNIKT